jgi:hypothetical protein
MATHMFSVKVLHDSLSGRWCIVCDMLSISIDEESSHASTVRDGDWSCITWARHCSTYRQTCCAQPLVPR